MAVEIVDSGAVSGTDTGDTLTFASVNAGAGDCLLVFAVRRVTFTGNILSGVTFGVTGLTEAIQFNPFDGTQTSTGAIAAFRLVAPSGIDTITVTFNAATNQRNAAYYVLSGVDQTTPLSTIATTYQPGPFNKIGGTTTDSQDDGLVVDCVGMRNNVVSTIAVDTAGQVFRHAVAQTTSDMLATSTKPGASSVTMRWAWTGNEDERSIALIPVNPAQADHRRLVIGGFTIRGAGPPDTGVTQDVDFTSTINASSTDAGVSGANTFAFAGHRIISAVETIDYSPTLDRDRLWIAGIAAYKGDVLGGGTTPAPEITSSLVAETTEGAAFSYQIDATNNPISFSAEPLPAGLTIDENGVIIGNTDPGTANKYNILLGATNSTGTGTATLVLTVHPAEPAPPGGVFKHKPLPTAIMATLGQVYAASTKF